MYPLEETSVALHPLVGNYNACRRKGVRAKRETREKGGKSKDRNTGEGGGREREKKKERRKQGHPQRE